MLGISFQQIQKYECGKNSISINRLLQLSIALNSPIEDLISGITPSKESQFAILEAIDLPDINNRDLKLECKKLSTMKNIPHWPRGMNDRVAAAYTGMKLGRFKTQVMRGFAPAPINLDGESEVWIREHLDAWLERMVN